MTMISRDPFARTELHREVVHPVHPGAPLVCRWCGGTRERGRAYEYRTEHDGGRVDRHPGQFCSISCFRSYST